ncbi:MAG: putative protein tyrosine phosphatase [Akkermansiaceae bacterium]
MRLLFLCSKNKLRSPTAECLFAESTEHEVDSAGLSRDAEIRLSDEQVRWADLILVMEKIHRSKLNQKYGHVLRGKKVVVLGIPDIYEFMDKELVLILRQKCAKYL